MANFDTSAHAGASEPSIDDCKEQVRRVVQSPTFRNAATLQLLLQFLTDKTIIGAAESLKEYTIGVEALGRKSDFDPKIDPIVRVQSHRLRVKLREYYEVDGYRDPILIQLHKGHYAPTFETMPAPTEVEETTEPKQRRPWLAVALAVIAIILIVAGYWLGRWRAENRLRVATSAAAISHDGVVEAFWTRFLGSDSSPVMAYPDAVFLLDDSNDLFRFRHGAIDSRGALVDPHVARQFASNPEIVARAGQLYYENGYTGTGELESVGMLAGLLERMGVKPIIKSSRDVTPDDLHHHNVILLGSPFQNPAVAQLMAAADFSYSNPDQHREQWRAQILNAHPRGGEAPAYGTERDSTTRVLTADYSLITIAPSVIPGRWIAILGGLDTKGTEGAAMFVTSKHGVERLNKSLDALGDGKGELVPFQALLKIQLAKGYQVLGADLISVHPIQGARPEAADGPPPAR